MRITATLLFVLVSIALIFSFAEANCDSCKNALRTIDNKLPGQRSRQQIEGILNQQCEAATGMLPVGALPLPLPIRACDAIRAHRSALVEGLVERREYTQICQAAGMCDL
eukprot:gene9300-11401_t